MMTVRIYSWLPLGSRMLQKVERIVREEQDRTGAHEMLMPMIQPADLWRESGRCAFGLHESTLGRLLRPP